MTSGSGNTIQIISRSRIAVAAIAATAIAIAEAEAIVVTIVTIMNRDPVILSLQARLADKAVL